MGKINPSEAIKQRIVAAKRRQARSPAATTHMRESVCNRVTVVYPKMDPLIFCAYWLNASEEDQEKRGYRTRCIKLMAYVLRLSRSTVGNWGTNFEQIPPLARTALGYFYYLARHREVFAQLQGIGEDSASDSVLDIVDTFIARDPESWSESETDNNLN